MERARHVFRVGLVLFLLVAGMSIGRLLLVPPSYGASGAYRQDSVQEIAAKEPVHGGTDSCKSCHEKEYTMWKEAEVHVHVQCEVCHGALGKHALGDKKIGDAKVDVSMTQCAYCHKRLEGRSTTAVPQLVFEKHKEINVHAEKPCLECHNPHSTFYEEEG